MEKEKLVEKLQNYNKALNRLREAVEETDVDQYVYDSIIQRFEFTYELSWKLLKAFLEYKGLEEVRFPRDVFKEVFAAGLIPNQDADEWLDMMKDRNTTSHTYDEEDAQTICERIKNEHFAKLVEVAKIIEGEILK